MKQSFLTISSLLILLVACTNMEDTQDATKSPAEAPIEEAIDETESGEAPEEEGAAEPAEQEDEDIPTELTVLAENLEIP